jgi:TIR domain
MACRLMPPSEQPRVFISYARKDGAALARRLQKDLDVQGFDAWLDTQRIAGRVWSTEIKRAIKLARIEFILATLGSARRWSCLARELRPARASAALPPSPVSA